MKLGLSLSEKLGLGGGVVLIVLFFAALGGWIANIVKFAMLIIDSAPVTTLFVGRGIGIIFPPLGAFLGFF